MSRILSFIFFCLVFAVAVDCLSFAQAFAQDVAVPRFEDYPAVVWRGKIAPLDLRSHPLARKFRTVIREQREEAGVNFAGHYTIASAGCGTGCSITAVVDARTGRAYFPNEFNGWTGIVGDYEVPDGEEPWTFRAESRLLKAIGRPRIGKLSEERYAASGIYYYEWKNNRLRLIKFIPVGSYPNADPPLSGKQSR